MRVISCFIVLFCLATSCLKSSNSIELKESDEQRIETFIDKLELLPVGYKYDLVSQDTEKCYRVVKTDSVYFSEYMWIVGYLPDTTSYYAVLYLEPGDDLYPSLRVFSKSGKTISSDAVSYADCAAGDCGVKECSSLVEITGKNSLLRSLTMSYVSCDSLGKETGELQEVRKKQLINIDVSGAIKFEKEE